MFRTLRLLFLSSTERAAPGGRRFLLQRAEQERVGLIHGGKCWDSEEAHFCQPSVVPVLGRPSGTFRVLLIWTAGYFWLTLAFQIYLPYLFVSCSLASWRRKLGAENPKWTAAEKSGGVGDWDGNDNRQIQQNENGRPWNRLQNGPAQEREGSRQFAGDSHFCSSLLMF